jgi:hypothetical protein
VIFDKSLKILNYATINAGNLELYTELNHSFVAGDKVFIVGGYYDNTEELLYTTSYNILTPGQFNPYAVHKTGYVIKSVNYANNSFVLEYPVSTLHYPYGVTNNPFGNPQDTIFPAYNNYIGLNMFKNVYVSRTCFINGRFKKGTIHNGVFGNDYHKVYLNLHDIISTSAVMSDISVTHIAAKHVSISAGVITSKTDSTNPSTIKMMVVEDNTLGTLLNPFAVANVAVNANNDTWGYSVYEQFKNAPTGTYQVVIYNGDFSNPNSGFITFNNMNIIKAKVGSKEPIDPGANLLYKSNLYRGSLHNFTNIPYEIFDFGQSGGGTVDTFIDLKPYSVSWGVNPGEIVFNVEYDVVANKNWKPLTQCYISGITPILARILPTPSIINDNSDRFDINFSIGDVVNTTYTFGNLNSAQITLSFQNLIANWATWSTLYTPADFDFSQTKVSLISLSDIRVRGNSTVSIWLLDNYGRSYFDSELNKITVKEGAYFGLVYHANTDFVGNSIGESILLLNGKQLFQSNVTINSMFDNVVIQYTQVPVKGNISNSKIYSGYIHNSTLTNVFALEYVMPVAVPYSIYANIYLYNTLINGSSRIDAAINWDKVQFDGTPDTVYNVYPDTVIIENSYFGQRKTPFKTAVNGMAPLNATTLATELNKIEQWQTILNYESQSLARDPNVYPLPKVPQPILRFQVPSLENVQPVYDGSKYMSIIDHGDMIKIPVFSTYFWVYDTSKLRSDILFADILNNDMAISTKVLDRTSYNISGIDDIEFPGVDPLTANYPDIRSVDQAFIHDLPYHNYRGREMSNISINVYDNPAPVAGQPDPAYVYNTMSKFIKLIDQNTLVAIDNIMPGATAIPDGYYQINFRHYGPFEESCFIIPLFGMFCVPVNATNVISCYIEVERITFKYYDNTNTLRDALVQNLNYCPTWSLATGGQQYSYTDMHAGNLYPQDFPIMDNTGLVLFEKITGDPIKHKVVIELEYWLTWYYDDVTILPTIENMISGSSGGYREKKTDVYTLT